MLQLHFHSYQNVVEEPKNNYYTGQFLNDAYLFDAGLL